ncbi:hypothetical protein DFR50_15241 [Roseiarcus fermentans]|uniref:Uncharacterized protein n=1 Tax=Roseiarcus fermentans TaxID=1473586 RepID=A0A366EJ66_9HYPH|nr:hypothetical protein [Roseiarcus fermentans]RBP02451.1 hypothetical protein DFR50_15241 [Roseiarcus fermentans]
MATVEHSGDLRVRLPKGHGNLRWLVTFAFGFPFVLIALAAFPIGSNFAYVLFGIPLLFIVWLIVNAILFKLFVRYLLAKAWRQSLIALAPLLIFVIFAVNPIAFIRLNNHIGDLVHFVVLKRYYDERVAALPNDAGPRLAVFNWGGMIWASHGLVYDESDQVSLPRGRQSTDWVEKARRNELSCEGYSVHRLWDHYYLASFPC